MKKIDINDDSELEMCLKLGLTIHVEDEAGLTHSSKHLRWIDNSYFRLSEHEFGMLGLIGPKFDLNDEDSIVPYIEWRGAS